MEKRSSDFYRIEKAKTERLKRSAIPFMTKMLNNYHKKKKVTLLN